MSPLSHSCLPPLTPVSLLSLIFSSSHSCLPPVFLLSLLSLLSFLSFSSRPPLTPVFLLSLVSLVVFQDCCLIVYHPYRPLLQYVQDMGQEDMLLPLAWYVIVSVLYTRVPQCVTRRHTLSISSLLFQADSERHVQDRSVSALPALHDRPG